MQKIYKLAMYTLSEEVKKDATHGDHDPNSKRCIFAPKVNKAV